VSGLVRITSGLDHSCGLTSTGAAYCWGFGYSGKLGNGSTSDSGTAVPVSGGMVFKTP
jgi:alpha-tubulin suppressor-like RCC1 family protein